MANSPGQVIPGRSNFIGCAGAGGTGKTTTCMRLVQHIRALGNASMYGQWDFMPSTSRTAFQAMGLEREDQQNDLSPEQTIELQFMIQKMFIQQCKVHAQQNMVFDRSPLDHAAYAMLNCASFMRDTDLNHLYDYLKTTLPLFGFIFYFPRVELFGSVLDDGMRSQSEARRACHDWLLQGIARERNVELVRMPSGSVADRVAFMLMVMKSHREIWSSPIG